jgi:hypothetical protein
MFDFVEIDVAVSFDAGSDIEPDRVEGVQELPRIVRRDATSQEKRFVGWVYGEW